MTAAGRTGQGAADELVAARVAAAWAGVLEGHLEGPVDHGRPFLSVGGHSLAAARLVARVRDELGVSVPVSTLLRDDPTLDELVVAVTERLAAGTDPRPPQPPPASGGRGPAEAGGDATAADAPPAPQRVPLAPTLRRVWAWHRLHPQSPAYNVVRVLSVAGRLDPATLRAALRDLLARHDALRCSVDEPQPGRPEVRVGAAGPVPLTVEVLGAGRDPAVDLDAALHRIADQPFPMSRAPLWRIGVVYVPAERRSYLVLVMHHLVSDMRSTNVVLADLAEAYRARAAGGEPAFPGAAPSLLAHLEHESGLVGTQRWSEDLQWWAQRLAGVGEPPPPPLAVAPDGGRQHAGRARSRSLPAEESDALDRALRAQGLTPASLFLTAAGAVIGSWDGDRGPLVLGVPSVRLSRPQDERIVGFLLDTLLLPMTVDPQRTFRQACRAVRDAFADAVDHAVPVFDDVVERLRLPRRSGDRTPLIRLWFNDLTQIETPEAFGAEPAVEYDLPPTWALFDLALHVRRGPDGYRLHLVAPDGLFRPADLAALLDQVVAVAVAACEDGLRTLAELLEPSDGEATPAEVREPGPTTADLVREHARSRPGTPALVDPGGRLDYAALEARVDEVARTLVDVAGPGAVVALPARRDRQFVVRLLACRRAGVTPVLVDAGWPQLRRRRAERLAAVTHAFDRTGPGVVAVAPEGACTTPGSGDPGHVLFTSGTTGDPLAVRAPAAVTESALADLVERLGMTDADRVSMISGAAHDPVLRDVGLALRAGATLCIPPADVSADPRRLSDWLRDERVTVVNATPVLLALALGADPAPLPDLRVVVCGGSPLPSVTAGLIRRRAPRATIFNGYGCTETPQLATLHEIPVGGPGPDSTQVPVGEPLPGRRVEVRTSDGRRCAVGQLGELWVAAPHIAHGYAGAADEGRFVTDRAGTRWFRTGDLARRDAEGRLHLAGRRDRQVLVNSHRVALEDVESVARSCDGVVDALARVIGDENGQALQVWVQRAHDAVVTEDGVRTGLAAMLPPALLPTRIHVVARLALTENLKPAVPDVRPAPDGAGPSSAPVDARLHELAEAMVGAAVDPTTNFFDAGFTSVTLLQLCAELGHALGRPVEPLHVFERPNLLSLSAFLFGAGPDADADPGDGTADATGTVEERARRLARLRSARRESRMRVQDLVPPSP